MIVKFKAKESIKVHQYIGKDGLQIATIFLSNKLTLLTHNIRKFEYLNGALFKDWGCNA